MLADAARYPATHPVIIAGDMNTHFKPGAFLKTVEAEGFRSCFGEQQPRTHRMYGRVDWILVRGPVTCEQAEVDRKAAGSDHFPLTAVLVIQPPQPSSARR